MIKADRLIIWKIFSFYEAAIDFRQLLKDDIEKAFKNFRKDMINQGFEDSIKLECDFYLNIIENFNKYNEINLEIMKI